MTLKILWLLGKKFAAQLNTKETENDHKFFNGLKQLLLWGLIIRLFTAVMKQTTLRKCQHCCFIQIGFKWGLTP
jgi:hypothetical protein